MLVKVVSSQVGVARGGQYLEHTIAHLQVTFRGQKRFYRKTVVAVDAADAIGGSAVRVLRKLTGDAANGIVKWST